MNIRILLISIFLFLTFSLFAQIPDLPSNLTNVRSADINEAQISQVSTYLTRNNISTQEAYQLLLARGMNNSEASLLKDRLDKFQKSNVKVEDASDNNKDERKNNNNVRDSGRIAGDTINKNRTVLNPKKIFGLEIFNNGVLTFEPNLKIATPVGYVIGPDDELNINIYGFQEAKYTLKVGPEGDINVPYVGIIYVAGLTIEQATAKIKSRLSASGYSNLRTGLTKINITVGRIRSIRVTVLGEVVKPGNYTIPSLATAFNALYLSGGPTEIGSMRNIQIIRNGRIIDSLDIYDFLIKGDQKGNINLRDQDVLRIPTYKIRVSLEGELKRTGLFEIKPGENVQNLIDFAGGFSDSAFTESITAYTTTGKENQIIDISEDRFSSYKPLRFQSFIVRKVLGRFINKVSITGAVYLPGDFEYQEGLTLKGLITKAQGLRENAYNSRGLIIRRREDLTPEIVSFSPLEVFGTESGNILLKANDSVSISTVEELKEKRSVTINGEVRFNGEYPFVENMSLKDLVLLAGGFTDAAIPQKIEIASRIRTSHTDTGFIQVSEVIDVTSLEDLTAKGPDFRLKPFDIVVVRKNPSYQKQVNVQVEGEVLFPGTYVLKSKNERISDIIKRAGGLTSQAFDEGGYVTRLNKNANVNKLNVQTINRIQETLKDTSGSVKEEIERTHDQIAIDVATIMANPKSRNDLTLEEGDVITIPKERMDVRISGQVLFPTRVVFARELDLKDYLGRAGGVTDNARKGKIYVLYPNGNAAKTGHFLFFRTYPKVSAGSEIIVPKKHEVERRRLSTGEIIGISTAITSFAGVLLSLLINMK